MMSYVKLFSSTMHSSIWMEPDHVLKVWITMLLMADRDGVVEAAVPGLARAAGKTIPETEEALQRFLTPDQYSRTPDNEGRRIEPIAGGWRLLNYEIYRDKQSLEERREKDAARQRRKREREAKAKRDSVDSHSMSRDDMPEKRDVSRPVTAGHVCHDIISSHNNSEADKSKSKSKGAKAPAAARPVVDVPDWIDGDVWNGFTEMRKQIRKPMSHRAAGLILAKLARFREAGESPNEILDQSTRNGWQDVFHLRSEGTNNGHHHNRKSSLVERAAQHERDANARRAAQSSLDANAGNLRTPLGEFVR